jgi:hypothetical protein
LTADERGLVIYLFRGTELDSPIRELPVSMNCGHSVSNDPTGELVSFSSKGQPCDFLLGGMAVWPVHFPLLSFERTRPNSTASARARNL